MKKVVILTGAGAVLPWGAPTTKDITEKIKNDKEFVTKNNKPLGKYLYSILREHYKKDSQNINFEHIIDFVDLLYAYYQRDRKSVV